MGSRRRRLPTAGASIPRRRSLGEVGGRCDVIPADIAIIAETAFVRIGRMRLDASGADFARDTQRGLDGLRRFELRPGGTLNTALEAPIRHAFRTQSKTALQGQQVELWLQQIPVCRQVFSILCAA